jgi:hypothetical protein
MARAVRILDRLGVGESKVLQCCGFDRKWKQWKRNLYDKVELSTLIHSTVAFASFSPEFFPPTHFFKLRAASKDVNVVPVIFDGDEAGSCIWCSWNPKYCQRQ